WLQLGSVLLLAIGFAGYPLSALVPKVRRGSDTTIPGAARWLTLAGLSVLVGLLGYLGFLQVTAAETFGPVIAGRPLPWLVLQVISMAAIVGFVVTAIRWWADRGRMTASANLRPAALLFAGVVFVPWAV